MCFKQLVLQLAVPVSRSLYCENYHENCQLDSDNLMIRSNQHYYVYVSLYPISRVPQGSNLEFIGLEVSC